MPRPISLPRRPRKALAKAGILAGLFKILLAAKKLLVLGAIAAVVVLKRWLGRKDAA